jgi:glucosamine--fructose-6-phosphate aminotransferase (isomerizing)
VPKSTITRDADFNLYTYAGPEIAVATTKAYSCQLIVFYLLALQFSKINNVIKENEYLGYINELQTIPSKVQQIIDRKDGFQKNVSRLLYTKDFFYIGRGIDYAVCLEGALKLKEITYVNAVAYPAGELKHGTISLIDEHVFVVACATQDELYEKMKSNMIEVKSRKGKVLAVVDYGKYDVEEASIAQEYLPNINNLFTASIAIIPMQLMAYYLSVAKGIDPDKPKNLAKSVTVE